MPINILMPALSPTMEDEAADEGTLAKIVVPEGTADVPVNQPIAVLAGEGEDVKAAAAQAGSSAPAPAAKPAPAPAAKPAPAPAEPPKAAAPPAPEPEAKPAPKANGGGRIF